jgi:hypothetical protein
MTDADIFTVNRWGTPPEAAVKPRNSKYGDRIEVVRARNKTEPEVWGVIADFSKEASARSRQSLLRKEHKDLEIAINLEEDHWLLWARVKPR